MKDEQRRRTRAAALAAGLGLLAPALALAQEPPAPTTLVCASQAGERVVCPADTSAGVALVKSTGSAACLLGKTWGYDDAGVWVTDGCGGEFLLGQGAQAGAAATAPTPPSPKAVPEPTEYWGEFSPGKGFLIGRSDFGEMKISGYALGRYMNQMPAEQTFTDHLGREHPVDTRNDIFSHRVLVFLNGWLGLPKLKYAIIFWTVNTTDQNSIFGNLGYQFSPKFGLYTGINGNPGTRSLNGSHPYWLGNDRVMADEFFRPFFSFGVWAQGEPLPGFWYNAMVGNNSSTLGATSAQLDRHMTTAATVWWMPTTHEFGPRGGYGDWAWHEKVATRFGTSFTNSRELRQSSVPDNAANTSIKLADSLNVFDTGSLVPGVTVKQVNYRLLAVDAGLKYKGFFLQAEVYTRWLDGFVADGPLPVDEIVDKGFYVQAAFYPIPKKLELYAATSQIYGDEDAGFSNSSEYLTGLNFYPANSRDYRLNVQVADVHNSPVNSSFGYYIGGHDGTVLAMAFSVFF